MAEQLKDKPKTNSDVLDAVPKKAVLLNTAGVVSDAGAGASFGIGNPYKTAKLEVGTAQFYGYDKPVVFGGLTAGPDLGEGRLRFNIAHAAFWPNQQSFVGISYDYRFRIGEHTVIAGASVNAGVAYASLKKYTYLSALGNSKAGLVYGFKDFTFALDVNTPIGRVLPYEQGLRGNPLKGSGLGIGTTAAYSTNKTSRVTLDADVSPVQKKYGLGYEFERWNLPLSVRTSVELDPFNTPTYMLTLELGYGTDKAKSVTYEGRVEASVSTRTVNIVDEPRQTSQIIPASMDDAIKEKELKSAAAKFLINDKLDSYVDSFNGKEDKESVAGAAILAIFLYQNSFYNRYADGDGNPTPEQVYNRIRASIGLGQKVYVGGYLGMYSLVEYFLKKNGFDALVLETYNGPGGLAKNDYGSVVARKGDKTYLIDTKRFYDVSGSFYDALRAQSIRNGNVPYSVGVWKGGRFLGYWTTPEGSVLYSLLPSAGEGSERKKLMERLGE